MSRPSYEPFADTCANAGRDDYWTCPGCYHDLGNIGSGRHTCPECERAIECEIDHQPVCVTSLVDAEGEE